MGGFAPPVPTPASTTSGVRTTTQLDSATSLIRNVDPDLEWELPDDSPLTVLTKAIRKPRTVDNVKFEWTFMPDFPKDFSITTAATSAATQFVFDSYTPLRRGQQFLINRTGEVFTIGGSAEPSSTTVDVVGRAGAQAVVAGDTVRLIGSAHEENAEKPAIRTQTEQYFYNYTQQHYEVWGVTNRDANSGSYIGKDLELEKRKAMQKFNRGIEESAIFGRRYLSTTAGYSNSSALTYSGGAAEFIKSNNWYLGTGIRPTEGQLWEFFGELMTHGAGGFTSSAGEARKIAFLGPAWFALIEGFAKNKIVYDNITDAKKRIGIKVGILQSSVGDIMLKLHPLFALVPALRSKMLVLDINQVKYVHMKGGETTFMNGIQTPGSTRTENGVIADCGWEYSGDERAHGWADCPALVAGS